MEINKNLTSVNRTVCGKRDIKYIVVHYTGNNGDTAYGNTQYFKTVNRSASAHYFVDADNVWQCVEDKDIAWHCGTKGTYKHPDCRNANSIGIEMCDSAERNAAVEARTAELVKLLMQKYGITADRVIRHYDVTGKQCPLTMTDNNVWKEFINMLTGDDEMGMTEAEKAKMNDIDRSLANAYRILEEQKTEIMSLKSMHKRYDTIESVPEWARPTVQRLADEGKLNGDGGGLGLSGDMLRILVILSR